MEQSITNAISASLGTRSGRIEVGLARLAASRTSLLIALLGLISGTATFLLTVSQGSRFDAEPDPLPSLAIPRDESEAQALRNGILALNGAPRTLGALPEISESDLEFALNSLRLNPVTLAVVDRIRSLYGRSCRRMLMHESDGTLVPVLSVEGRIVHDALTGAFGFSAPKSIPHAAWIKELATMASGVDPVAARKSTPIVPADADNSSDSKRTIAATTSPIRCAYSTVETDASEKQTNEDNIRPECIDRSEIVSKIQKNRLLAVAILDVELSAALLLVGQSESGRLRWVEAAELLWTGPGGTARMIEAALPATEEWVALRNGLERLRAVQQRGGFVRIEPSWTGFKVGTKHAGVEMLRMRLHAEGYAIKTSGEAATPTWFDNEVSRAISEWQRDHSLESTGILDRDTVSAMNIPVEHRIAQVRYAMQKFQSSGVTLHSSMIRVLIPGFVAKLYKNGRPESQHRVIVGKATRSGPGGMTPEMTGSIHTITAHPSWTPTQSFIDEILIPAERKNPGETKRRNLVHVRRGDGSMALTQPPGPKNPLGRLVLRFQEKGYYYLHDTPDKHLFKKVRRDASSGCVRVENIEKLATEVAKLGRVADGTVESALARDRQTQHISVPDPVPVSVEYVTVDVGENGRLRYFLDVYRLEESLLRSVSDPSNIHVEADRVKIPAQETASR